MNKLLLIDLNPANIKIPIFPLGIYILGGIAIKYGWKVRVLDYQRICNVHKSLLPEIEIFKPDLIGVSIRNIDNTEGGLPVLFLTEIEQHLKIIAELYSSITVLGGAGYSLFPNEIKKIYGFHYGIEGRSGNTFSKIILQIDKGKSLDNIFREKWTERNDSMFHYSNEPLNNMWNIFPETINPNSVVGFDSQTGCCSNCIYCSYPLISGRGKHFRPHDEIVEFINNANRRRINNFQIVDDVFNDSCEHAIDLCEHIIMNKQKAKWRCYMNPIGIDRSFANTLSCAGCEEVIIGVDSLSNLVLDKLRKPFTVDEIAKATKILKSAGIIVTFSLILCSEFETEKTIAETIFNLTIIRPNRITVQYGLRIYPGTILAKEKKMKSDMLLVPYFSFSETAKIESTKTKMAEVLSKVEERKML